MPAADDATRWIGTGCWAVSHSRSGLQISARCSLGAASHVGAELSPRLMHSNPQGLERPQLHVVESSWFSTHWVLQAHWPFSSSLSNAQSGQDSGTAGSSTGSGANSRSCIHL